MRVVAGLAPVSDQQDQTGEVVRQAHRAKHPGGELGARVDVERAAVDRPDQARLACRVLVAGESDSVGTAVRAQAEAVREELGRVSGRRLSRGFCRQAQMRKNFVHRFLIGD